jgi:hypothetical protein
MTRCSALAEAQRALTDAKQNEGHRLAAVALGEATDVASAADMQVALEQARNNHEVSVNTSAALQQRLDEAVNRARTAAARLEQAVAAVVKSEAQALIAEQVAVCRRLAELRHIFNCLVENQCGVVDKWGFDPEAASPACAAPWRLALDALRSDPDARLPTG